MSFLPDKKSLICKSWIKLCALLYALMEKLEFRADSETACQKENAQAAAIMYRDDFIQLIIGKINLSRLAHHRALYMDLLYKLKSSIPNSLNPELGVVCHRSLAGRGDRWENSRSYHGLIAEAITRQIPFLQKVESKLAAPDQTTNHSNLPMPTNHWDCAMLLLNEFITNIKRLSYEPGCMAEINRMFEYLFRKMNSTERSEHIKQLAQLVEAQIQVDRWGVYHLIESLDRHLQQVPRLVKEQLPDVCADLVCEYMKNDTDFAADPKDQVPFLISQSPGNRLA